MPSFYVPKKNRCPGCLPIGNSKLTFATNSSMNAIKLASKTVYGVSTTQNTPAVQAKKGSGNRQKRGSGGNSYYAYLAKKTGSILCCDCCQEIVFSDFSGWDHHPNVGDIIIGNGSGATGIIAIDTRWIRRNPHNYIR